MSFLGPIIKLKPWKQIKRMKNKSGAEEISGIKCMKFQKFLLVTWVWKGIQLEQRRYKIIKQFKGVKMKDISDIKKDGDFKKTTTKKKLAIE